MPGRVLIADDSLTSRIDLAARLAPAAHEIVPCETAETALASARDTMPDLMLVSGTLAAGAGFNLAKTARALPGGLALPVALVGDTSDRAVRLAALEASIDAFIDAPPPADLLLARVRNLLHRTSAEKELCRADPAAFGFAEAPQQCFASTGQITLIAPSVEIGKQWRSQIAPLMRDRIDVLDPACALAELNAKRPPDALVIAPDPGGRGRVLRLLSDLRCRADTRRAAIILLQDRPDPRLAAMALDLGVDDVVDTRFDSIEMVLRLRRELARKARNDRRRDVLQDGLRLAATDPLTGLYNRRYAMAELERIIATSGVDHGSFALMALDLDRFKRVNDTYGHAAGDKVLTEVSRRMTACLRGDDFLARIGGEEFLAVVRSCDAASAAGTAERLRRAVSARPVAVAPDIAIKVTLSIGLVQGTLDNAGKNRMLRAPNAAADLLDLADKALYAAKADGRNQVSLCKTAA